MGCWYYYGYYGCRLAIVNPPILPQHAFCIVHRDVRYYNDPVTRLPPVILKSVCVHFHPRVLVVRQRYPVFSPFDLIVQPYYFHFLNMELLSWIWIYFTAVSRVDKHGLNQHLCQSLQSQQWKYSKKVWIRFKVNNRNTRTTLLMFFWYVYCLFWTYFTPCSSVSNVDFVQINAS